MSPINETPSLKLPSLEQQIGQMIVVGFSGLESRDPAAQKILDHAIQGDIGGVIFFRYNFKEGPEKAKELVNSFKDPNIKAPLFLMLDQEGGKVQRLGSGNGFRDFLSHAEVASTLTPEQARTHYREMGDLITEIGLNFNFAPCVDMDREPSCSVIGALGRSFGKECNTIVEYAREMIGGLHDRGVLSCIKHYPGHGSAQGDTHDGLVEVSAVWHENELAPFKKLIEEGHVDSVMSAHIVHNVVDPGIPATLSAVWLNKLRHELGFNGVIASDDLHMGAIQQHYSFEEIVLRGIEAGLDLLVFSNNSLAAKGVTGFTPDCDLSVKVREIVLSAIQSGRISAQRITESYQRITNLKRRL